MISGGHFELPQKKNPPRWIFWDFGYVTTRCVLLYRPMSNIQPCTIYFRVKTSMDHTITDNGGYQCVSSQFTILFRHF